MAEPRGFADLPGEVLEMIFSKINLPDLLRSHTLVCRKWNEFISSESFLPQRKRYYRYQAKMEGVRADLSLEVSQKLREIPDTYGNIVVEGQRLDKLERCLPFLIYKVSEDSTLDLLKLTDKDYFIAVCNHPRYELCSRIMEERFHSTPKTNLGIAVLLISTAPDLEDITLLLDKILYHVDNFVENKIVETLYLLLTYLNLFRDEFGMPWRVGYLLFHALFLHQNRWTAQAGVGAGDSTERNLTAEQRRVVNMDLGSLTNRDIVRIMAYAGTGKTTTLLELTKRHPNIRFLLIVFNKSVETHSRKVFPRNVTVKTANALSYRFITKTQGIERFQSWNIKHSDLLSNNLIKFKPKIKGKSIYAPFNMYHWAAMIIDTINRFCNSADSSPGLGHVPSHWIVHPDIKSLLDHHKDILLEDTKDIWKKIRTSRLLKYDHTTSMKEFQLSEPDLKDFVDQFDVLLLDEAQDMNPCMLDVCLRQKVPKIVVGDSYQQIYGFRGAVNALELSQTETCNVKETYYLTQSFRFGAEIAFAAECCLKHLLGAKGPSILGTGKRDSVTGYLPVIADSPVELHGRLDIIGRTNLALFSEMVNLVCKVEEHQRPKIAFPTGGEDPQGWEKLIAMSHQKAGTTHLLTGKSSRNPTYKKPWPEFVSQVKATNDMEMAAKISIVEKYGSEIPTFVKILQKQTVNIDDQRVRFVFSTVHKYKGLETDNVRLLDDFNYEGLPYIRPKMQGQEKEELNLLYVALTRAKSLVVMNDALYFLLTSSTVDSCYEVLREPPLLPTVCVLCAQQTEQYQTPAVLWQRPLSILRTTRRVGGYLCSVCGWATRRKVYHRVGGHRRNDPRAGPMWKVHAGTDDAGYHAWLRRIISPQDANPDTMRQIYKEEVLDKEIPRDLRIGIEYETT